MTISGGNSLFFPHSEQIPEIVNSKGDNLFAGSLFQGIQSTAVWSRYSGACIKAEGWARDPVVSKAAEWQLKMKEHR